MGFGCCEDWDLTKVKGKRFEVGVERFCCGGLCEIGLGFRG